MKLVVRLPCENISERMTVSGDEESAALSCRYPMNTFKGIRAIRSGPPRAEKWFLTAFLTSSTWPERMRSPHVDPLPQPPSCEKYSTGDSQNI